MDKASVCQVGIAKVVNGEIVDSTSWLVKPPTGLTAFEPRFISIHGITPNDVRRSGISWQESLQRISTIAGDLPFVAHNTGFDKTVYARASERVGVSTAVGQWFDTLTLARRYVTAPNHKLPTVAKALNLPDFSHHEAEADAITSARIALVIAQQQQLHTIQELWTRPAKSSTVKTRPRRQAERPRFSRNADLPMPNSSAHPDHPFFGRHVVITGNLNGFSREEFIVKVAELGGQPQLNVTKKTAILIVAHQEAIASDYDYSYGTGKERKAIEYKSAGQDIEIIGAKQALQYLKVQKLTVESPSAGGEQTPPKSSNLPVAPTPVASNEAPPVVTELPRHSVQETPEPPKQEPMAVPPAPSTERKSVAAPPETFSSPKQPEVVANSAPRNQRVRQPSFRTPSSLVKVLAWTLMVVSGLFVMLFVLGATATLFSADYPDTTFFAWTITLNIAVPIMSAPGLLGFFLVRRYKKRDQSNVSA